MRSPPDCKPPPTAWHAPPPSTSTSHTPQQQDEVHSERPCTGKGASAGAGLPRSATRQVAGRARGPPPPPPAPPTQSHTPRSPANNNRTQKGRMSCHQQPAFHHAMQQRCHHASASARSPPWPLMPRPRQACQAILGESQPALKFRVNRPRPRSQPARAVCVGCLFFFTAVRTVVINVFFKDYHH
jgi:hypothetical protein